MKALKKFELIIESIRERIQTEVSSLIGEELAISLKPGSIVSKADFFEQPIAKVVLAHMEITGDVSGKGALVLSTKDAIRLGGTLIMLPPTELEEAVGEDRYDGETEDSYGEIANIIAGCYTKAFEEMYPKACRFIRKEQELIVPLKVDEDSEEPVPKQKYYLVTMGLKLEGNQMGDLFMLVPAVAFGLIEAQEPDQNAAADSEPGESTVDAGPDTADVEAVAAASEEQQTTAKRPDENLEQEQVAPARPATAPVTAKDPDAEKNKKKVDALLELCREKTSEEVSALLGVSVSCGAPHNVPISKEDFFYEEASGKQVCALMDVVGDTEDQSFLFIGLKDAIRIGGTLIMLPPNELEAAVAEEEFGDDSQDAYGEIANIIAGVYTAVFEEQYTKSLRFIRKEVSQVVPMKVDVPSDEPIPDQLYYLSSMTFGMNDKEYGKLQVLFPARLFGLEYLGISEEETSVQPPEQSGTSQSRETVGASGGVQSAGPVAAEDDTDVLLVSDCDSDTRIIERVLDMAGLSSRALSFRDPLKRHLPGKFKAVFLVMKRVDEQAIGMAIKIGTNCSLPIIAAGPEWTRSMVIKAVKYGVTDIIVTPAESQDVEAAIKNNILSLAA